IETQVPCSTIVVAGDTLTVDFGELGDACTYNGHTYAGIVTIAISIEGAATIVDHTYSDFTNGNITMNGTKKVTYQDQSR
ncbi:MAG: hypothetical protein KC457_36880, partial [Myxococcales bacterium]|nr:hypothetical protein [Myxococcales bacterium]